MSLRTASPGARPEHRAERHVAVMQGGELLADVAIGVDHRGEEMRTDHISCLYCCSKVPLYAALLALLDAGVVRLDTQLGEILEDANPWVGSCTIAGLVCQRGGMTVLPGPISRFVPDHLRRTSHQWLSEPKNAPRGTQSYSVSEVGWLVALVLERTSGEHYADALPAILADALGPDVLQPQLGALTVTYQHDPSREAPIPLLNEQTTAVRTQWNPSLGWYASAGALTRFGAALSQAWHGRTKLTGALVQYATTAQAEPEHDIGLDRIASHGLGFWTNLELNGYGRSCSPRSFGHAAQGGTSFLLVDPERELSVGGCFDISLENDTGEGVRRAPLVDAIIEAVDG